MERPSMRTVSRRVNPRHVLGGAAILGLVFVLLLLWATVAQGAFRLDYAPGVERSGGIAVQRVQAQPTFYKGRSASVSVVVAPEPVQANGDAFWRALDNCESPNGDTHPLYQGDFQFHPDTARRAGGTDLAAAKRWASMVVADGGHPGSTAGWPVCWWRAKAAAGYAPY